MALLRTLAVLRPLSFRKNVTLGPREVNAWCPHGRSVAQSTSRSLDPPSTPGAHRPISEKSRTGVGTRAVLAGYLSIKCQAADKECSDGQGSGYRDGEGCRGQGRKRPW